MPHPITGKNLRSVQDTHNIRGAEMCWLLGCSSAFYQDLLKRGPDQTKEMPAPHALMIRLLLNHPNYSPIPKPRTPDQLLKTLKSIDPSYNAEKLAILFGKEPSTGAKLVDTMQGERLRLLTSNYVLAIDTALRGQKTKDEKLSVLKAFEKVAEEEAQTRGIEPEQLWSRGWKVK